MNQDKYVFAQLVDFLDRNLFNYLVKKYGGDRYVKHFTCWNQLLVMMFGHLTNRITGGTLQEPMAGGTLLQMAEAAFENQEILGHPIIINSTISKNSTILMDSYY